MNLKSGQKYGYLELIEETFKMDAHRKRKYWKCKCLKCGKEFIARDDNIKCGDQVSCGCVGKGKRAKYLYFRSLNSCCNVQ